MYICAFVQGAPAATAQSPDQLYQDRANIESARRAAEAWADSLLANPGNFEAAWKLSRANYWLGSHVPEGDRRRVLEQGVEAGRKASALEPARPEGYFWTAANMGSLAESFGLRAGLKYRKPIKEALETVLRIDRGFLQGSADRALGRWYFKVPSLFGGSHRQSELHLRESLKYNPHSTSSHFFLAELFMDDGRKDEARAELQKVLDAPALPEWAPEDQEFKVKAQRLLQRLR